MLSALYTAGKLDEHMFTMCLLDSGGLLVLGGLQPALHTTPVSWTPMLATRAFYTVTMESATINGQTFVGYARNTKLPLLL